MKIVLSLTLCVGLALAYPDGAPKCDVDQPGHGDSTVKAVDSKLELKKTADAAAGPKHWIVTMSKPDLHGVLIRPAKSTPGKFTSFDADNYKELEGGKCVTHKDSKVKSGVQTFKFEAEGTEEPQFDGFVVGKAKEEYWPFSVK